MMLGAIAGDIIGSVYEFAPIKTEQFPLFAGDSDFTDDTVLTVAIAESILNQQPYGANFRAYCQAYPRRGYGGRFYEWVVTNARVPYNSWGNGSAMRVSPVGWAFADLETVLAEAKKSAAITHNHPQGILGAQATAAVIFLARTGKSKQEIKTIITERFGYNLSPRLAEIRPEYTFDESCQGTVPPAIIAFLESRDYEDTIRKAVSLGGDADTLACIAGSMAEAFYGPVPQAIAEPAMARLDARLTGVLQRFQAQYIKVK